MHQSSINFTVSVFAAILGFLVILYSLFQENPETPNPTPSPPINPTPDLPVNSRNNANNNEIWARVVQAIILESVAALFFVQTNNTRKTMVDFSDKLRLDRNLTEALKLIEKIQDKKIQSKVKALLVLNFSGLNMKYDDQEILKQIINMESITSTAIEKQNDEEKIS